MQVDSQLVVGLDQRNSLDSRLEVARLRLDCVGSFLDRLDVLVDRRISTDSILVHLCDKIRFSHQARRCSL